ncbi:Uncharacterised protein [uncultured archaeon]|nr:Uncharacterised protein [uncultured archaeon]
MSLPKSRLMLVSVICGTLLAVMALSQSVHSGAECASLGGACNDSGWDPMQKEQSAAKWPEKSRMVRWNQSDFWFEDEENKTAQNATPAKVADDQEGFELAEAEAKPNPVRSGSTTTITASFREKQTNAASNSSGGEIKLTIKGCSTCEFEGFSLGTAGAAGNKSGMVQLGSSGKSSPSSWFTAKAEDSALRCTAIVNGPDGSEAERTSLLRTSGYKYVGIWNANVAPGIYKVSISASASGSAETFADVLEIEVTG